MSSNYSTSSDLEFALKLCPTPREDYGFKTRVWAFKSVPCLQTWLWCGINRKPLLEGLWNWWHWWRLFFPLMRVGSPWVMKARNFRVRREKMHRFPVGHYESNWHSLNKGSDKISSALLQLLWRMTKPQPSLRLCHTHWHGTPLFPLLCVDWGFAYQRKNAPAINTRLIE